ncbi:MAG: hypothetical protein ACTSUE_25570 [Promethearchaeota archaeon]
MVSNRDRIHEFTCANCKHVYTSHDLSLIRWCEECGVELVFGDRVARSWDESPIGTSTLFKSRIHVKKYLINDIVKRKPVHKEVKKSYSERHALRVSWVKVA